VDYDPAELDGYFHRWWVIGHLMGVRPDILPFTRDDAEAAAQLIRFRQDDASSDGRELTRALIGAMQGSLPYRGMRGLIPATVRWYVGDDVANLLGIERTPWTRLLEGPVRQLSRVAHVDERHDQVVGRLMRAVGMRAFAAFMDGNRGGERPTFSIPTELAPRLDPGPKRFRI
jgi:hypothetical protein